jgi:hypothetical protein
MLLGSEHDLVALDPEDRAEQEYRRYSQRRDPTHALQTVTDSASGL